MKIIHYLSYPGYGGAEKYALNIASRATLAGHQALFVVDSEGPLTEKLHNQRIGYRSLRSDRLFLPLRYIVGIRRFKKIVREFRPEVVHTHFLRENLIACLVKSKKESFKILRTIHRLDRFESLAHKITKKFINRKTDQFIAPSEYAARILVTQKYDKGKIAVIPNGADELEVKTRRTNTVGLLTRLEKGKGALELVQNLPHGFSGFNIWIAGDGDCADEINEIIRKKELNSVKTLGRIDDLTYFFSNIDLLLHPSTNESTLPMSVIEALGSGKEAIIFDLPVFEEFNGPGIVKVKSGDWESLIEKTKEQLRKPEYSPTKIREYFRDNFSNDILWNKIENLYQEALG